MNWRKMRARKLGLTAGTERASHQRPLFSGIFKRTPRAPERPKPEMRAELVALVASYAGPVTIVPQGVSSIAITPEPPAKRRRQR